MWTDWIEIRKTCKPYRLRNAGPSSLIREEDSFMQTRQNEAGFTLIGMLIAVGIVAILALIAVPKFTSAIASANTARIQSDLSTLNTAIAIYEIDNGKAPKDIADLKDYLQSTDIKPPTGDCYMEGKPVKLEATRIRSIRQTARHFATARPSVRSPKRRRLQRKHPQNRNRVMVAEPWLAICPCGRASSSCCCSS